MIWHGMLRTFGLGLIDGFIAKRGILHKKYLMSYFVTGLPHFATMVESNFANFYLDLGVINLSVRTAMTVVLGISTKLA